MGREVLGGDPPDEHRTAAGQHDAGLQEQFPAQHPLPLGAVLDPGDEFEGGAPQGPAARSGPSGCPSRTGRRPGRPGGRARHRRRRPSRRRGRCPGRPSWSSGARQRGAQPVAVELLGDEAEPAGSGPLAPTQRTTPATSRTSRRAPSAAHMRCSVSCRPARSPGTEGGPRRSAPSRLELAGQAERRRQHRDRAGEEDPVDVSELPFRQRREPSCSATAPKMPARNSTQESNSPRRPRTGRPDLLPQDRNGFPALVQHVSPSREHRREHRSRPVAQAFLGGGASPPAPQ